MAKLPKTRFLKRTSEAIGPAAGIADTSPKAPPRTTAEMLQMARQEKETADKAWDIALEKAKSTLREWQRIIQEKAQQAATELQEVDILEWKIPNDVAIDPIQSTGGLRYFCAVTVLSRFSNEPLILRRSGLHGRIGRLTISPTIGNNSKNDHGVLPFPQLVVRATPICYDDYDFKEQHHTERLFNNPEEAFEVFLSLVIANSVTIQYDVRYVSDRRQKDGRYRINDHGWIQLNMDALSEDSQ